MKFSTHNGIKNDGFSLMELLVASAILVVIVLIMSSVFHQSNLAWDSGTRKAQGSMTARSLLGFMSRELSEAVADGNYLTFNYISASKIRFVTLSKPPEPGRRLAKRITYEHSGDSIFRTEQVMDTASGYGVWGAAPAGMVELATNIVSLAFSLPPSYAGSGVPEYVGIKLKMKRMDDVSGVAAYSAGPNGVFGDEDDIASR